MCSPPRLLALLMPWIWVGKPFLQHPALCAIHQPAQSCVQMLRSRGMRGPQVRELTVTETGGPAQPDPTDLSNPAPVQNRREHQLMCRHQGNCAKEESRAWLSLSCEEEQIWEMHFGMEGHCPTSSSLEAECERPTVAQLEDWGYSCHQAGLSRWRDFRTAIVLSFIHLFIQQIPLLTSASTGPETWVDKGPTLMKPILQSRDGP